MKMRKNRTREERAQRNLKIVYLLWAVFVIVVLVAKWDVKTTEEPQTQPPHEADVTQTVKEIAPVIEAVLEVTVAEVEEAEVEAVEAAEPDPVREDIPMDAETQRLLYRACDETGVAYELALAVVWKETNFRNIAGDGGKSAGYMQVQRKYHSDRMERHGVKDLTDPYGNFLVGCDYLAELIAKEKGLEWALMAYNGGPSYANKLAKAGKVSQYAKNVLNYMNNLGGN